MTGEMISGFEVRIVEAGTKITDNRTGESAVVGDDGAVIAGNFIYCTRAVFDQLKAHFKQGKL